jgi:hypothetical protein
VQKALSGRTLRLPALRNDEVNTNLHNAAIKPAYAA